MIYLIHASKILWILHKEEMLLPEQRLQLELMRLVWLNLTLLQFSTKPRTLVLIFRVAPSHSSASSSTRRNRSFTEPTQQISSPPLSVKNSQPQPQPHPPPHHLLIPDRAPWHPTLPTHILIMMTTELLLEMWRTIKPRIWLESNSQDSIQLQSLLKTPQRSPPMLPPTLTVRTM